MWHEIWEALRRAFHLFGRWDGITAISTAAAAIFTARMAYLTRKAIKDGQDQRDETNGHFEQTRVQDKLHHEDSFRPLLVLAQTDVDDIYSRRETVWCYFPGPDSGALVIKCLIRNIGVGPALNVKLRIHGDREVGFVPSRDLLPMAAGSEYADAGGKLEVLVYFTDGFKMPELVGLTNGLWVLELQYEDIFGTSFRTFHYKESSKPWTRSGPALVTGL